MLLAGAGCLFVSIMLHISGVHGRASRVCGLKGSTVDLLCSAGTPASGVRWYTVHWSEHKYFLSNFSGDGIRIRYTISENGAFFLTISDVQESDANVYCCSEMLDNPGYCWFTRIQLQVTDLQVKVTPTTEEQTVTLTCSTSCPLTEEPAAYIWYKNGEFLYEDWSPWYQELVSSDAAVTYSCAVKGYEHLSSPEVSVDSLTPTCFTVTYAEGTMCSYNQKPVDEPCNITYPKEVHVQRTPVGQNYVKLTCTPSCALTHPQTAYRWYWNKQLYRFSESQSLSVGIPYPKKENYLCAVKGHEDLHTAAVCLGKYCQRVNYVQRRICALQGSSVNISSEYLNPPNPEPLAKIWYKIKRGDKDTAEKRLKSAGRMEYHESERNHHVLMIKRLRKSDSAEYVFRYNNLMNTKEFILPEFPGVTLVVSGLKVRMTPSAVVWEGQRVTLTCSTSCPLPDNTTYIWYLNGQPLTSPENRHKHLVLGPVNNQHAGNYFCTVEIQEKIRSPEETLTVKAIWTLTAIINTGRLLVGLLILVPLLLFHLWLRLTYKHHLTRGHES